MTAEQARTLRHGDVVSYETLGRVDTGRVMALDVTRGGEPIVLVMPDAPRVRQAARTRGNVVGGVPCFPIAPKELTLVTRADPAPLL